MAKSNMMGYLPNDAPPMGQRVLLGFQHVLTMFPATAFVAALCGFHVGTVLFMSGVGTIVALTLSKWQIGKFIPLFYGSSFSYIAAYLAIGAAGAVALERTIGYVGGEAVTILHAPFASGDYADAAGDNGFDVDALTVTDEQVLEAYTSANKGAFVVRRGEKPVIIPLPGNAGSYWEDAGLFTLLSVEGRSLNMRAAGDRVLYAGRGDDFGERVRAALEAME